MALVVVVVGECAWWHECRAEAEHRVFSPGQGLDLAMCAEHRDEFVTLSGGYFRSSRLDGGGSR